MKLNTIFGRFAPKENKFFPIMRDMAANVRDCSNLLITLAGSPSEAEREDLRREIKHLETKGDRILDHLFDQLNNTFITPFDREDINQLGERIDDVLDGMHSAAKRIDTYKPQGLPQPVVGQLAQVISEGCELIYAAIDSLEKVQKNATKIKALCQQLHDAENKADDLYEHFITNVFVNEKDSIELIKLKEITQELERTTDRADAVGKILKTIIVKYA
ncbi:MAG: DUF47 family protein [Prevotellaceae bacterium]|jgi:predicted phosphate transport protein (TIGR00153 family)|nr:DUF47 family protein [Prevotellaceae bacterium]